MVVLRGCTRIWLTMDVNSDGDVSTVILIMMNLCPLLIKGKKIMGVPARLIRL